MPSRRQHDRQRDHNRNMRPITFHLARAQGRQDAARNPLLMSTAPVLKRWPSALIPTVVVAVVTVSVVPHHCRYRYYGSAVASAVFRPLPVAPVAAACGSPCFRSGHRWLEPEVVATVVVLDDDVAVLVARNAAARGDCRYGGAVGGRYRACLRVAPHSIGRGAGVRVAGPSRGDRTMRQPVWWPCGRSA